MPESLISHSKSSSLPSLDVEMSIAFGAKSPSNHLILYWLSSRFHPDVFGVGAVGGLENIENISKFGRCSVFLRFSPLKRVGKVARRRHPSF